MRPKNNMHGLGGVRRVDRRANFLINDATRVVSDMAREPQQHSPNNSNRPSNTFKKIECFAPIKPTLERLHAFCRIWRLHESRYSYVCLGTVVAGRRMARPRTLKRTADGHSISEHCCIYVARAMLGHCCQKNG